MRDAIAASFPDGTRVTDPEGGFLLWVELPPEVDALALYRAALAEGVRIAPGPLFSPSGVYDRHIRVSCGMPWDATVADAVERLGRAACRLAARR